MKLVNRLLTLTSVIFVFTFVFETVSHAAVLASVGTKSIRSEDIKQDFSNIPDDQKKTINKDLLAKQNIVDGAINNEVLYQSAVRAGFEKNTDYLKAIENFKKQYLASLFLQKSIEPKLSNSNLKQYYDSNKKLFDESQVCAFHIVVQSETEAKTLLAEIKKPGADFSEIARKSSLDPSVQENGGDLGCFTRERMVKPFSDVAFSMKKGEINGPVATSYGYHVIKVYDQKSGRVPNFEEIAQKVKDTYRLKVSQELLTSLRSKSKVHINKDEVKNFSL